MRIEAVVVATVAVAAVVQVVVVTKAEENGIKRP